LLALDPTTMMLDNQTSRDLYNKVQADLNEECMNFIYYHYMSERKDTEFWKTYTTRTEIPTRLQKMLELWKVRPPKNGDLALIAPSPSFDIYSWYLVGAGVNNLDKNLLKEENEALSLNEKIASFKKQLLDNITTVRNNSLSNIQVGYE
jgi:hypothetical protein